MHYEPLFNHMISTAAMAQSPDQQCIHVQSTGLDILHCVLFPRCAAVGPTVPIYGCDIVCVKGQVCHLDRVPRLFSDKFLYSCVCIHTWVRFGIFSLPQAGINQCRKVCTHVHTLGHEAWMHTQTATQRSAQVLVEYK